MAACAMRRRRTPCPSPGSPLVCSAHRAVRLSIGPAIRGEFHLHVQELGDVVDVVLAQIRKRGHAGLGPPVLDDRTDLLVLLIVQHRDGANQVGPWAPRAVSPWQAAQFCLYSGPPLAAAAASGAGPSPRNSRVPAAPRPPRCPRPPAGGGVGISWAAAIRHVNPNAIAIRIAMWKL